MRVFLLFLLYSSFLFSQNSIIELKIDSITSSNEATNQRKYIINYHVKNLTDKRISFLLNTSKNDTLHGVKVNSLQYNLYQDEILVKDFYFLKQYDYVSVSKLIKDLRNSKSVEEEETIKNNPELLQLKIHPIFLEKIIGKREPDHKKLRLFENTIIYNTLKTLEPKEIQHYQLMLHWNKDRYFKNEDTEYYLDAENKYTIELSFTTLDYDYLYFDSTEGFEYDKSLFFNSTNVSNTMPFHFDE